MKWMRLDLVKPKFSITFRAISLMTNVLCRRRCDMHKVIDSPRDPEASNERVGETTSVVFTCPSALCSSQDFVEVHILWLSRGVHLCSHELLYFIMVENIF